MFSKVNKDTPELKQIVQAVGSRKRSAMIMIVEENESYPDLWEYWDGGSCDHYEEVCLTTFNTTRPKGVSGNPPQFGGKVEPYSPKPNTVLVNCGTFCGKKAYPKIYIQRTDLNKIEIIEE